MKKYATLLTIDAIVAIAIPVFIEFGPYDVDKWIEVIIGITVFTLILGFQILYYTTGLSRDKIAQETLVLAQGKTTPHLKEFSENYASVVQLRTGNYDTLFEDILWQELVELCEDARMAAHENAIKVKDHHFSSHSSIENAFKDSSTNIYREIYILNEQYGSPDYIYWNFFEMLADLVRAKEIEVRTLFVRIKEDNFEHGEPIQKLLRYYHFTKGFDKKIIDQNYFTELREAYHVERDWVDFGIYGNHLIFKTQSYDPLDHTDGVFSKNNEEVKKCMKFFDKAWRNASKIEPNDKQKITLDDLIGKL
jgi:hypothetical protein